MSMDSLTNEEVKLEEVERATFSESAVYTKHVARLVEVAHKNDVQVGLTSTDVKGVMKVSYMGEKEKFISMMAKFFEALELDEAAGV